MSNLSTAVSQMIVLSIVVILGLVLARKNYIDDHVTQKLTKILINVTLPCMIVASVSGSDFQPDTHQLTLTIILAFMSSMISIAAGALFGFCIHAPKKEWAVYTFMSLCNALGFIGIPVVAALFGNEAVLFASIYVLIQSIFLYSFGFILLRMCSDSSPFLSTNPLGIQNRKIPLINFLFSLIKAIPWKSAINPAMAASLIAVGLFFGEIKLPCIVNETLTFIGSITSPVAMLVIGSFMATFKLKEILSSWQILVYILYRKALIPLLVFFALQPLIQDSFSLGIMIIMFSMPVGSMTPLFCAENGLNESLSAKAVILSTIASFAFIPFLYAVMTSV